jgi:hypothetical protein
MKSCEPVYKPIGELFKDKSTLDLMFNRKRMQFPRKTLPTIASKKREIGKQSPYGDVTYEIEEVQQSLHDSLVLYRKMMRECISDIKNLPNLSIRELNGEIHAIHFKMSLFLEQEEEFDDNDDSASSSVFSSDFDEDDDDGDKGEPNFSIPSSVDINELIEFEKVCSTTIGQKR